MHEDNCLPPIELLPELLESRIAQITALIVAEKNDAIRFQVSEGTLEFRQGPFDVRQW